ncbi:MAG: Hsp70 family protein, partial [Nitrospinota bacterium]
MTDREDIKDTLSRFIIGIDLGTTNSTISYVDTQSETPQVQTLPIPQVIAPGEISSRETLPSYLFLPESSTIRPDSLNLPWAKEECDFAVGIYAKNISASTPGKVVSSAKSWLCCENIDRKEKNLPVTGNAGERKLSSVETISEYLRHMASAWDFSMAKDDPTFTIFNQQVVLTVPASFDAVARELTVKAAEKAGLSVTLLEEPQAAFYAWLHEHQESFREKIQPGETILVCDIGGGTTDFSLIGVDENEGDLELTRIAVGDHILLGGDNMDITLAYRLQQKIGSRLNVKQMAGLIHSCRTAKEKLSENTDLEEEKITVLG